MRPEDDRTLNSIYSADQLFDFRLRARSLVPYRATVVHAEEPEEQEEHDMDDDVPPAPIASSASKDFMHQFLSEVCTLSGW